MYIYIYNIQDTVDNKNKLNVLNMAAVPLKKKKKRVTSALGFYSQQHMSLLW